MVKNIVRVIPIYPNKRDMVMMGTDIYLMYYHNMIHKPHNERQGAVNVYLDVSGSFEMYLPEVVGILSNMKRDINKMYLFSNSVVETDMETLSKGKFDTTYGTDFDCIIHSIQKERGYTRIRNHPD